MGGPTNRSVVVDPLDSEGGRVVPVLDFVRKLAIGWNMDLRWGDVLEGLVGV